MRTLSRRVWLLLGLATLLAVVLLYLNSRRPSARVTVVQATRETFGSSISSNGKVEPITPYSLRAKFDGFVERVVASEGKNVRKGELLMTMNDRDIRAQLDQARAQLASQQDDLARGASRRPRRPGRKIVRRLQVGGGGAEPSAAAAGIADQAGGAECRHRARK